MKQRERSLRMGFFNTVGKKIDSGALVVDVRSRDEYEDEHFHNLIVLH